MNVQTNTPCVMSYTFHSESVSASHPCKLAEHISVAALNVYLEHETLAKIERVAVITAGLFVIYSGCRKLCFQQRMQQGNYSYFILAANSIIHALELKRFVYCPIVMGVTWVNLHCPRELSICRSSSASGLVYSIKIINRHRAL